MVPRHYSDLGTARTEAAQLVELHAAVHHGDLHCSALHPTEEQDAAKRGENSFNKDPANKGGLK